MRHMNHEINWELPNDPIWINVAGPRGAGKRKFAFELYQYCVEKAKAKWKIKSVAVFIPGNVVRFIAQMVDLDQGQNEQLKQAIGLFKKYRLYIEQENKEALTAILAASVKWNLEGQPLIDNAIEQYESAEIETLVDQFEYEPEVRQNLRQILRKVRHYLSYTENVQIIISGNPGHVPNATLNFFLLRPREVRVKAINEISGAGDVVSQHDLNEEGRVKRDYEVIQSKTDRETDPSARLVRYPGHFVPISVVERQLQDAVKRMQQHLEAVVTTQLERNKQRRELISLFERDRRQKPQGTFSILLLKGGGFDKFYGSVNAAILRRLTQKGHFDIFLGSTRRVSLDHALIRWNFLEERMSDVRDKLQAESNASGKNAAEFIKTLDNVIYLMQIHDHWRLNKRLEEVNNDRSRFPLEIRELISRALTFLKYVTTASQYILLKRRSPREDILIDWGLSRGDIKDGVRRADKNKYFDVRSLPAIPETHHWELPKSKKILGEFLSRFDEQEFVKLMLIGGAGEDLDQGRNLRSMVWNVLKTKPHGWFDDLIEADLSIDDFASIVNGVHGPNGPRGKDVELQKEISLLPIEDVITFNSILRSELEEIVTADRQWA